MSWRDNKDQSSWSRHHKLWNSTGKFYGYISVSYRYKICIIKITSPIHTLCACLKTSYKKKNPLWDTL